MKLGLIDYAQKKHSIVKEPLLIVVCSINALNVADVKSVMALGLDNSTFTWAAAWGVFLFWTGFWFVHLLGILYGKHKLHRSKHSNFSLESPYPGVSIIKPLTGTDPNLYDNLETFFNMKYPKYELLFCVGEKNDPALSLVHSLLDKYPHVDAKVFIGGERIGVNPKINNIQPGYAAAKYDLFMISDSGIRMKEDTLIDMVHHMDNNVGLVHQMPFAWDREGFSATFQQIYFATSHARIYLSADFVGINCATGMSALMRKEVIDKAGGMKAFGCYLAEDFFFAKCFTDNNWKITISSQPAWQNPGTTSVRQFLERVMRWAQLRIAMVPTTSMLEPLSECMLLGVLASLSMQKLFSYDPLVVFLVHCLVWFLLDYVLLRTVHNGTLPFSKFQYLCGWLLRELSALPVFIVALLRPTIRWRTGVYRLKWGGIVEEVPFTTDKLRCIAQE